MRRIVVKRTWQRAVPLALAALLILGACDDEEDKDKVVEVHAEEGVEVRVIQKGKDEDEMIIVGELALFTTFVIWALFGPGATARRAMQASESR